jgi:hypothetical protein
LLVEVVQVVPTVVLMHMVVKVVVPQVALVAHTSMQLVLVEHRVLVVAVLVMQEQHCKVVRLGLYTVVLVVVVTGVAADQAVPAVTKADQVEVADQDILNLVHQ